MLVTGVSGNEEDAISSKGKGIQEQAAGARRGLLAQKEKVQKIKETSSTNKGKIYI